MSKIICDVCGTSYPETSTQCPICGCVRSGDAKVVAGDTNEPEAAANGSYTYVKGGRFSKTNVKKRNKAVHTVTEAVLEDTQSEEGTEPSNKGLFAIVIVLLLAIIAIVVYIAVRFFVPADQQPNNVPDTSTTGTTQSTEASTTESTLLEIPCTGIATAKPVIEFTAAQAEELLEISLEPADTTDEIVYTSSDETIATVTAGGVVTAVAPGEAVITVTCGEVSAECRVVCSFEAESTQPDDVPEYSTENFKFRKTDITMGQKGQLYVLYKGEIPVELITWTTDNEKVATVENGTVKAVGKGTTRVYGEYGGVKLECIVRCSDTVGAYTETGTSNGTSENTTSTTGIHLNKTDVTLRISGTKSFTLKLCDENGNAIETEWTVDNEAVCSIANGLVEALAEGSTTISTTYNGVTYKCIVRVKQ